MKNKAIAVELPITLWSDLSFALMRSNDTRKVNDIVAIAVRRYLATDLAKPTGRR